MILILLPLVLFFGYFFPKILEKLYFKNYGRSKDFYALISIVYPVILLLSYYLIFSTKMNPNGAPTEFDYYSYGLQMAVIVSFVYGIYKWVTFKK